ncbi:hypothetical protein B0T24DRAFT_212011 [Lasiosphaeria ovina]|uniref:Uncharacterized protein n=1 Tax=Lasiosphaeria ovina TaxID=92902 RepID=A0AAE0KH07_9PEZI|nr:hypothetical protein B0T24DRAFT_212011 [Lasiosphaeria ovina]
MCQPPSQQSVGAILWTVWPNVTVERLQPIPSFGPQRIYEVVVSNGKTLILVLPPPSILRLLRSEQLMVASEAVVVRWARAALSRNPAGEMVAVKMEPDDGSREPAHATVDDVERHEASDKDTDLLRLLPTLVHSSQERSNELGFAYSFLEPTLGSPLALVSRSLSSLGRQRVDGQMGQIFRQLARLTSPSGMFGPAVAVLAPSSLHRTELGGSGPMGVSGAATWTMAFHSMLESVLRDGEDMAITIPYSAIRRQFQRLSHFLDSVSVPRLVAIDGTNESVILVSEPADGGSAPQTVFTTSIDTSLKGKSAVDNKNALDESKSNLRVCGLRDWSNCIFGDPLLATVFSEGPSESFLEGFNITKTDPGPAQLPLGRDIIDDVDSADVRLIIYQAYHATASIVREFYRPHGDSSRRELEARRRLNEVLSKLVEVQADSKRKHPRPSGEMSPAKRIKPDEVAERSKG